MYRTISVCVLMLAGVSWAACPWNDSGNLIIDGDDFSPTYNVLEPSGLYFDGTNLWSHNDGWNTTTAWLYAWYDSSGWTTKSGFPKQIHCKNGTEHPDTEGITFAANDADNAFIAFEKGCTTDLGTYVPGVLMYDVTQTSGYSATHVWDLNEICYVTSSQPWDNLGLEAITFISNGWMEDHGAYDEYQSADYDASDYTNNITGTGSTGGVFVVGCEGTADAFVVVLEESSGTTSYTVIQDGEQSGDTVLKNTTGIPAPSNAAHITGLEMDEDAAMLWAVERGSGMDSGSAGTWYYTLNSGGLFERHDSTNLITAPSNVTGNVEGIAFDLGSGACGGVGQAEREAYFSRDSNGNSPITNEKIWDADLCCCELPQLYNPAEAECVYAAVDLDCDGDVDALDWEHFKCCLAGSTDSDCDACELTGDDPVDIDLFDLVYFLDDYCYGENPSFCDKRGPLSAAPRRFGVKVTTCTSPPYTETGSCDYTDYGPPGGECIEEDAYCDQGSYDEVCHSTTSMCVECEDDADCADNGLEDECVAATNTCEKCEVDADCRAGMCCDEDDGYICKMAGNCLD